MPLLKPDPTFYPSPTLATQSPREKLAYVALISPGARQSDAIGVVDVDPESKSYGRLVGQTDMPHAGDELHHFGWNGRLARARSARRLRRCDWRGRRFLGEHQKALDHHGQALSILRAIGERMNEATSLNNSAHVYLSLGQYRDALPGTAVHRADVHAGVCRSFKEEHRRSRPAVDACARQSPAFARAGPLEDHPACVRGSEAANWRGATMIVRARPVVSVLSSRPAALAS